jgi:hypothetical protein
MKKVIMIIGKPTHLRTGNSTACGITGAEYMCYDPRDVDCLRCMKTKLFKEKM